MKKDDAVSCGDRELVQDISINMPDNTASRPRTPPKEFYVGMPTLHLKEMKYYHHYIHVDEARGTEYIEHKDDLHHIQTILFIDHKKGGNITLQSLDDLYIPGESLTYDDEIPADVAGFCSLSNSYWLEEAHDHEWNADQKYQACICSYFHCWCTYCTKPDCWGNCHCHCGSELAALA